MFFKIQVHVFEMGQRKEVTFLQHVELTHNTLVRTRLPFCMCGSRRSNRGGTDGIFGKSPFFSSFFLIFFCLCFTNF